MKLLRETDDERFYELSPAELQMLLIVLSSFPAQSHQQKLSKFGDTDEIEEAQKLLDEALREQRKEMRQELESWMKQEDRFRQEEEQLLWRVENERREWLLQIFNDVRVGAWRELGSPEDLEDAHRKAGEESIRHLTVMDIAGMFQTALLDL